SADERQARGTHPLSSPPALLDRQFNILNELGMRIQVKQRCEPAVDLQSLLPFSAPGQLPKILILRGERDTAPGDPSIDPENRAFESEVIHPREYRKAIPDSI